MSKFFKAIIKSKKTKHPNKEVEYVFGITERSAAKAKETAYALLLEQESETGTLEFFQVPRIEKVEEQEFNQIILSQDASNNMHHDKEWPQPDEQGKYKKSDGALEAAFTLNDDVAEVATLQTSPTDYVMGYRYQSGYQKTTVFIGSTEHIFSSHEEAALHAESRIKNTAEFISNSCDLDQEQIFAKEVLNCNFTQAIMAQVNNQMNIEEQLAREPKQPTFSELCKATPCDEGIQVPASSIPLNAHLEALIAIIQLTPVTWDYSLQINQLEHKDKIHGDIRTRSNHSYQSAENALINAFAVISGWLESINAEYNTSHLKPYEETFIQHQNVEMVMAAPGLNLSSNALEAMKKTGEVFTASEAINDNSTIARSILERLYLDTQYSDEQIEEMDDNIRFVIDEYNYMNEQIQNGLYNDPHVDVKSTVSNFKKSEWSVDYDAPKAMLNKRRLRAKFREGLVEIPSFQTWSKLHPEQTFDDYTDYCNSRINYAPAQEEVDTPEFNEENEHIDPVYPIEERQDLPTNIDVEDCQCDAEKIIASCVEEIRNSSSNTLTEDIIQAIFDSAEMPEDEYLKTFCHGKTAMRWYDTALKAYCKGELEIKTNENKTQPTQTPAEEVPSEPVQQQEEIINASEESEQLEDPIQKQIAELNEKILALAPGESMMLEGIPNEVYHTAKGWSKSKLDLIAKDPALIEWAENAPVDPDKIITFSIGSALHTNVLEPHLYETEYVVAPEVNMRTNAGKAEMAEFEEENEGKVIITHDDDKKINFMTGSLMAHPRIKQILDMPDGKAEVSIFWCDPQSGLVFKIRPDYLTHFGEIPIIMDLKTTDKIWDFERSVDDFRYHVQDAFYSWVFFGAFGITPKFWFAAVSKTVEMGRYPARLLELEQHDKDEGEAQVRKQIQDIEDCMMTEVWGGLQVIGRSSWARKSDLI